MKVQEAEEDAEVYEEDRPECERSRPPRKLGLVEVGGVEDHAACFDC